MLLTTWAARHTARAQPFMLFDASRPERVSQWKRPVTAQKRSPQSGRGSARVPDASEALPMPLVWLPKRLQMTAALQGTGGAIPSRGGLYGEQHD